MHFSWELYLSSVSIPIPYEILNSTSYGACLFDLGWGTMEAPTRPRVVDAIWASIYDVAYTSWHGSTV